MIFFNILNTYHKELRLKAKDHNIHKFHHDNEVYHILYKL